MRLPLICNNSKLKFWLFFLQKRYKNYLFVLFWFFNVADGENSGHRPTTRWQFCLQYSVEFHHLTLSVQKCSLTCKRARGSYTGPQFILSSEGVALWKFFSPIYYFHRPGPGLNRTPRWVRYYGAIRAGILTKLEKNDIASCRLRSVSCPIAASI